MLRSTRCPHQKKNLKKFLRQAVNTCCYESVRRLSICWCLFCKTFFTTEIDSQDYRVFSLLFHPSLVFVSKTRRTKHLGYAPALVATITLVLLNSDINSHGK